MADYIYLGVKLGIYPPLIFLGIGTMTDFEPLIARPSSLLLGAAAQLGIFFTFVGAKSWASPTRKPLPSASSAVPMARPLSSSPPAWPRTCWFHRGCRVLLHGAGAGYPAAHHEALTTEKERQIVMTAPRRVSKTEKILFPIIVTIFVSFLVPSAASLIGCLMLGNLMRECGVVDRLSKTVQNELMNIVTIFLGISVGATATAENFLNWQTLMILALGVIAFGFGTAGGVLLAKVMNLFSKEKVNP